MQNVCFSNCSIVWIQGTNGMSAYCYIVGMQGVNGMYRLLFQFGDAGCKWYILLTDVLLL